jgi:hypothetical protein
MTHQSKDTQVTESDAATQKKEKEVDKNLTKETTSEEQDTQKLTQQSFDLPKRPTTEAIFTVQHFTSSSPFPLLSSLHFILCYVLTHSILLLRHLKGSLWSERRRGEEGERRRRRAKTTTEGCRNERRHSSRTI